MISPIKQSCPSTLCLCLIGSYARRRVRFWASAPDDIHGWRHACWPPMVWRFDAVSCQDCYAAYACLLMKLPLPRYRRFHHALRNTATPKQSMMDFWDIIGIQFPSRHDREMSTPDGTKFHCSRRLRHDLRSHFADVVDGPAHNTSPDSISGAIVNYIFHYNICRSLNMMGPHKSQAFFGRHLYFKSFTGLMAPVGAIHSAAPR